MSETTNTNASGTSADAPVGAGGDPAFTDVTPAEAAALDSASEDSAEPTPSDYDRRQDETSNEKIVELERLRNLVQTQEDKLAAQQERLDAIQTQQLAPVDAVTPVPEEGGAVFVPTPAPGQEPAAGGTSAGAIVDELADRLEDVEPTVLPPAPAVHETDEVDRVAIEDVKAGVAETLALVRELHASLAYIKNEVLPQVEKRAAGNPMLKSLASIIGL